MASYRLPGSRKTSRSHETEARQDYLGIGLTPHLASQVDSGRGAAAGSIAAPGVAGDDIIKITLESGIELWTSVDQAREDYGAPAEARGGEAGLIVPAVLPIGRAARGGGWLVKFTELFKADLQDLAASKIAALLEEKFESQLANGGPGLYSFGADARPKPAGDIAATMAQGPSLLFIHGTASCSEGGFGKMKERPEWEALFKAYGGRVFCFEHRTLSENPMQNAMALARALPAKAEIDLISHSRGGLVAELLCRSMRADGDGKPVAAFDAADKAIFAAARGDAGADAETGQLDALNGLFAEKQFNVRHLVRAACPARGTTLASRRLDRYLSIIVSALKLVPGLSTSAVFDLAMGLLLAVAKKRTDPRELPGLEAQMPDSPFIAMVNRPGVELASLISAISGDVEGSGIFGRLKVLATDLFYLEEHDLVVNTSAMYGGAKRTKGASALFDKGDGVNHFRYFANKKTAAGILAALTRKEPAQAGFRPIEDFTRSASPRLRGLPAQRPGPLPVAYLLPGIMGSELSSGGSKIWLSSLRMATGGIGKIAWGAPDIATGDAFAKYYGDLAASLARTHDVQVFAYDWRASLLDEGARLGKAVAAKLKSTAQPIRFVAHSMGGLVVRAMAAQNPGLWAQVMANPGARFLMLGTPNGGAHSMVATLTGVDQTVKMLALLDVAHSKDEILAIIAAYPGVLELLPRGAELTPALWARLRPNAGPTTNALAGATAAWKKIEAFRMAPQGLAYVAGQSDDLTPSAVKIENGKPAIHGTAEGDGRVTWATGPLPGVPVYYAKAAHGDLPRLETAFPAYIDLLATGKTSLLPTTRPAISRAAAAMPEPVREAEVEVYPTEDEALDAILGAAPQHSAAALQDQAFAGKIKITVIHGDLAFARFPVVVGHYENDTIRGSEEALDRRSGGRLSRKRRLGLYPGKLGTASFIPAIGMKPPGALIAGLGGFGDLSTGALRRAFAHALKTYADTATAGDGPLSLSTLLIGHRETSLALRDAISAMMEGLIDARRELGGAPDFKEIEIIELYEDTAINALRILGELGHQQRNAGNLEIAGELRTQAGRQRRIAPSTEASWARKIQIRGTSEDGSQDSLEFTAPSGSARASQGSIAVQGALIGPYLESLTASTATNRRVSRALFELLTPAEFKSQAADGRDVVLLLDAAAAQYPWELLDDRLGSGDEPMAVKASCTRQLIDAEPSYQAGNSVEPVAVVIGDSRNDPGGSFQELKGAQDEAREVASVIEGADHLGFQVKSVIRGSCAEITEALLLSGARIMHIAAHGVFEHDIAAPGRAPRKVTGMVLGDGAFFTAGLARQIRPFPELVFLNCCYLGKIAPAADKDLKPWNDRHRLAGNLGHEFIRGGAKAVVAAGWAVDDQAALTFAREFYGMMTGGERFSAAVAAARLAAYDRHPGCNTWGAYQCYGDPDYRLSDRRDASRSRGGSGFASEAEAAIELGNLGARAATASTRSLAENRSAVKELAQRLGKWGGRSSVQEALAKAFADSGLLPEAIAAYGNALAGADSGASLKAIEQLANLSARDAVARLNVLPPKERRTARAAAVAALNGAMGQLDSLWQIIGKDAATIERLCLKAGARKRIALVESGARRRKLLADSLALYENACQLAENAPGSNLYFPGLNCLLLKAIANVAAKVPGGLSDADKTMLEKCKDNAAACDSADPGFYHLAAQFDALIVGAIWNGKLMDQSENAMKLFRDAWARGGSHLELRALTEQLEFFGDCTADVKWGQRENLRDSARMIRELVEHAAGA